MQIQIHAWMFLAGEFIGGKKGEGAVSVLALQSDDMLFNVVRGENLTGDRENTAKTFASKLIGPKKHDLKSMSLLMLADA
jgi:hypothetical protein